MTLRITALIVTLVATLAACAEPSRGVSSKPATTIKDAGGDTAVAEVVGYVALDGDAEVEAPKVSFADDGVHDVLVENCTSGGCHGSGAGGYSIIDDIEADYAATLDRVVPGDADASLLLKKATATSSHAGGPVLATDSTEHDLVVRWIADGAIP